MNRSRTHPALDQMTLTDVMAALSDPIRLGLVRLLSDGIERGHGELCAPVAQSTMSHHLKVLRTAGITRTREDKTRRYVKLRRDDLDARFPGLLHATLEAARHDGVGIHVTWAPKSTSLVQSS